MSSRNRRGFTLLEMACVIGIIGILTGIAAPQFASYKLRAQGVEALMTMESIHQLEQIHILETNQALACEPAPKAVPPGVKVEFEPTEAWNALGFKLMGAVRYQYEVERTGKRTYVVHARGDLDGDGETSEYTLDGTTFEVHTKNVLE